jgi:hypothetical protein
MHVGRYRANELRDFMGLRGRGEAGVYIRNFDLCRMLLFFLVTDKPFSILVFAFIFGYV